MTQKTCYITKLLTIVAAILTICTNREVSGKSNGRKPGYYGGDGRSEKQAVIAIGFDYSPAAWIAKKYPGSTIKEQSLVSPSGSKKPYDVYRVQKSDGAMIDVWFLASGGVDDLISELSALAYPTVDLPGASTDAGDGFRIKFHTMALNKTSSSGIEYILVIFDVDLPRRIGKTQLDTAVGLEIFDNDGRTLTYAPLQPQKEKGNASTFHVCIDRDLAADPVLRCVYYDPSSDKIAKEYLIHLKHHLPPPD